MKTILLAALLILSGQAQATSLDKQFICGITSSDVSPWYNFIFTFDYSGNVALSWYQYPFKGAETVGVLGTTPGLQISEYVLVTDEEIYIEWSGDGDAGYADLEKNKGGTFVGTLYFPNSGPEPYADGAQSAQVECMKSFMTPQPIKHDVIGTVTGFFVGEADPFILGDVTIIYVTAEITRNGKTQTKTLGFVGDLEWLENTNLVEGSKVVISQKELTPLIEPSKLGILLEMRDDVEYYKGVDSL